LENYWAFPHGFTILSYEMRRGTIDTTYSSCLLLHTLFISSWGGIRGFCCRVGVGVMYIGVGIDLVEGDEGMKKISWGIVTS